LIQRFGGSNMPGKIDIVQDRRTDGIVTRAGGPVKEKDRRRERKEPSPSAKSRTTF
jgi:hypothetical protein